MEYYLKDYGYSAWQPYKRTSKHITARKNRAIAKRRK